MENTGIPEVTPVVTALVTAVCTFSKASDLAGNTGNTGNGYLHKWGERLFTSYIKD